MANFNETEIEYLNKIGYRDSFGKAILDLGEAYPNIVVMAADLSDACRVTEFSKVYPERFCQVGIAEQNMMGIASGFALNGFVPFTTTFASFASLKCCEQLKIDAAYQNLNIKSIGIDCGVAVGTLGTTHFAAEDIGALRSIPNIAILCPADGFEVVKAAYAMAIYNGPAYLRLSGGKNLDGVYANDYEFEIGKAVTLRDGSDLTIFATGLMVSRSLKAADMLLEYGVKARVINIHTLKPIDDDVIVKAALETKHIVTVEEHNRIGGLGSAVAEILAEQENSGSLLRIGLPDQFVHIGSHEEILASCGLTHSAIAETILQRFHLK